jgi:Domain of unknown function (DUF4926)
MKQKPKLLDAVALLDTVPVSRLTLVEPEYDKIEQLPSGLVGTIVEVYEQEKGVFYRVEFSDSQGCEYAMAILKMEEFLVLQSELAVL